MWILTHNLSNSFAALNVRHVLWAIDYTVITICRKFIIEYSASNWWINYRRTLFCVFLSSVAGDDPFWTARATAKKRRGKVFCFWNEEWRAFSQMDGSYWDGIVCIRFNFGVISHIRNSVCIPQPIDYRWLAGAVHRFQLTLFFISRTWQRILIPLFVGHADIASYYSLISRLNSWGEFF